MKNNHTWGRDKAKERYMAGSAGMAAPTNEQPPQDPIDKHDPNYDNDASGWVRGMGSESPYPHFDSGPSGNRHKGK